MQKNTNDICGQCGENPTMYIAAGGLHDNYCVECASRQIKVLRTSGLMLLLVAAPLIFFTPEIMNLFLPRNTTASLGGLGYAMTALLVLMGVVNLVRYGIAVNEVYASSMER